MMFPGYPFGTSASTAWPAMLPPLHSLSHNDLHTFEPGFLFPHTIETSAINYCGDEADGYMNICIYIVTGK
uniref:Homeobox domain-containing protein n=1 Tax=Parascaris univalens TaxID=6257 RepID=A0A915A7F7_PARUN